ncbi:MAG: hypothetical protein ACOYXB_07265 [Bacteroidota bacterium]
MKTITLFLLLFLLVNGVRAQEMEYVNQPSVSFSKNGNSYLLQHVFNGLKVQFEADTLFFDDLDGFLVYRHLNRYGMIDPHKPAKVFDPVFSDIRWISPNFLFQDEGGFFLGYPYETEDGVYEILTEGGYYEHLDLLYADTLQGIQYFEVTSKGKYGCMISYEMPDLFIPAKYNEIRTGLITDERLIFFIRKDQKWGAASTEGICLEFTYDSLHAFTAGSEKTLFYLGWQKGKVHLLSELKFKKGKSKKLLSVYERGFDEILPVPVETEPIQFMVREGTKWGIGNERGIPIYPQYDSLHLLSEVYSYQSCYMGFRNGRMFPHFSFYDHNVKDPENRSCFPSGYEEVKIEYLGDDGIICLFRNGNLWGAGNYSISDYIGLNWMTEPEYDSILFLGGSTWEGSYLGWKDGEVCFMGNYSDEPAACFPCQEVVTVTDDDTYFYLLDNGKVTNVLLTGASGRINNFRPVIHTILVGGIEQEYRLTFENKEGNTNDSQKPPRLYSLQFEHLGNK